YGIDFIHLNRVKTMLIGAVEDFSIQTFLGFYKLDQLSSKNISRPFDKERDGLIFSEAAVVFCVEEYETAQKRKASIHAEILSTGSSFDPKRFYRYNPQGVGMIKAMERALDNARLKPQDIDCIFSNANSTLEADVIEARAIEKIFGRQTPVTAIKSMTGETYSASGALALAAAIDALKEQYIPATINIKNKDSECRINLVTKKMKKKLERILINTFSPDGSNASFIIGKVK
ncbi:MAG TPA: beta-ketoacyl synthase N-terminal-like domain-containing protein, partial [Candidatus Omnitrophota bacterium]|nr:beta-ketoacyl synthase N-terminal-like domain-containing protein [Candidatus Omnitrophota bacterium]